MAKTTKTSVLTTPTAKATTVLEDSSPVLPLPDTPQGVMAVGPRVTLHFVQDYKQANSYNYYDVVNIDGTSYIAIKNVPANTPITDTEYWVKWNDPNAQFALLQDTVNGFNGRVTALENDFDSLGTASRKEWTNAVEQDSDSLITSGGVYSAINKTLCIIGDSYTQQGTWVNRFASANGFSSVKNYGVSGSAYYPGSSNNFTAQLNQLIADFKGKHKEIGMILVVGGTNDFAKPTSGNVFSTSVNTFAQTYAANLSDVFMLDVCCFLPPSYITANYLTQIAVANYYLSINGIATAKFAPYLLAANSPASMSSDNVHPSSVGYNMILSYLNSLMHGNPYFYNQQHIITDYTATSKTLTWSQNNVMINLGINVTYTSAGAIAVASLPVPIFISSQALLLPCIDNQNKLLPCWLNTEGKINVRLDAGTTYLQIQSEIGLL